MKRSDRRAPPESAFKDIPHLPSAPSRASIAWLLIRSAVVLLCLVGFVYAANAVLVPLLDHEFSEEG
jgi:hypothetical protein